MRKLSPSPSRRRFLGALAAAPAIAAVPAIAAGNEDTEILALEAEIRRINAIADDIMLRRIEPFDEGYQAAFKAARHLPNKERMELAARYSVETGRETAIGEHNDTLDRADKLFRRLECIPAHTQAGRASKVRTLLIHIMGSEWRGTAEDIDDAAIEAARALLGEFAGMSADDLAAV